MKSNQINIGPYEISYHLILSYLNNLITWMYNFKHEIKSVPHGSGAAPAQNATCVVSGLSYLILSYLNNLITWIYNFKHEIKSDQHWAL